MTIGDGVFNFSRNHDSTQRARPYPRRAKHTTRVADWSGCGLHAHAHTTAAVLQGCGLTVLTAVTQKRSRVGGPHEQMHDSSSLASNVAAAP